jgi:hydroxymethylpyrimidine pyrophosphatase-like HAD family hydrolase
VTSPLRGVRLIALDLDGTLLPSSKVLTDRAIGVIRDLLAAGIDVTLATGKGWNHTRRYADELGLTAPLVALEGALVARTDPHRALHSRTLPASTVGAVHEAVAGLDVGFFYCHDRWRTRVQRNLEGWLPQIRVWDPHTDLTDHAPHGADAPVHGAFVYHLIGPPDAIAAARARIAALDLPDIDLFHGAFLDGAEQLHVRPAGTDKRTGLTHALRDLGIAPRELLVAGDWWNDVGMMEMAGVVVAPSNAVPSVLDLADHVAPGTCEEDAVVRFLAESLRKL